MEHAAGRALAESDRTVRDGGDTGTPNFNRNRDGRTVVAAVVSVALIALLVGLGVGTNRAAISAAEVGAGPAVEPARIVASAPAILSAASFRSLGHQHAFWRLAGARVLSWSTLADGPVLPEVASGSPSNMAAYNDRPLRLARVIRMKVTAYSPDERSCGASADGITASGYSVFANGGFMVAADPRILPLGSLVSVPGYDGGAVVPVLDTGGAIKGNRLDVLYPTHELAVAWGVQDLDVLVWEYADGKPNDFRRVRRPSK